MLRLPSNGAQGDVGRLVCGKIPRRLRGDEGEQLGAVIIIGEKTNGSIPSTAKMAKELVHCSDGKSLSARYICAIACNPP